MILLEDGDTILIHLAEGDHFAFSFEGKDMFIYAPEILILTPKAVKWYKAFSWLISMITIRPIIGLFCGGTK